MAIAASTVLPTNSLEDFRIEFNNLVSDVSGITATNVFTENIVFEVQQLMHMKQHWLLQTPQQIEQ